MESKNKVTVKIYDRDYTVVANEPVEYIHKVAANVSKIMSEMALKTPGMSNSMAAVLTAMNAADLYYKATAELDKIKEQRALEANQLVELNKKMNDSTREINRLKDEIDRLRKENSVLKSKTNNNQERHKK